MSELKSPETCPKCQMPLEKSGSGSLTQWILICNCGRPEATDTGGPSAPISMCANCGKRVESGRSGTLTQWIFRADLCSCDAPRVVTVENTAVAQSQTVIDEVHQLEEMEELKVDPGSFPLDRYGPVKCLGQGASGRVYLCIDRLLNKRVAVKVLSIHGKEQLISFQHEAKATSQLNHPNIVKILDFGVTDGKSPYMVLDYISGTSLETILQEPSDLPIVDAVCLFERVCDALSYAHKRGVFHRDLKPSNIIVSLDSDGPNAWLIDFGVGSLKADAFATRSAQGETLWGSPAYMSPDVAAGQPFDARSEIYSFGCILYETFAGQPPFVGDTALETLSMHAHQEVPDLSYLSDKIRKVILTCLQKSPRDRYQNMDAVKRALTEAYSPHSDHTGTFQFNDSQTRSITTPAIFGLVLLLVTTLGAVIFQNISSSDSTLSVKPDVPAPELRQALNQLEEKKWRRGLDFMGEEGWHSAPTLTDEDFKSLRKEADVRNISVEVGGSVTGVGFRYLIGKKIKGVRLKTTSLSDEGLAALCKIKTVRGVHISLASKLSSKGLDNLAKLPELVHLDMTVLQLPEGAFESIAKIPKLGGLSLYNSKNVTLSGVEYLQMNVPRLSFIDLTGTYLDNKVVPVVAKMKSLAQLRLANLKLNDDHLELLGDLPNLRLLYISQNKITDKGLAKLGRCRNLEVLDITQCPNITSKARMAFMKAHPDTSVVVDKTDPILNSLAPLD